MPDTDLARREPIDGVACHLPGSQAYIRATTPNNSRARQRPALVAAPLDAEQVGHCVRAARERGLTVVPQATGHGAVGDLGEETLLLDTSGLQNVVVDPTRRTARVGAGCTWGMVQAAAHEHGLLGRAGSAPGVGVTGFTFGAGAGWLTRPHGLASSALNSLQYVDGRGNVRWAADDAANELDRDVLWACRGGGGVGIAVTLELGLVPVDDLWAGYLLWPLDALDAVVQAWASTRQTIGSALTTSIAVLTAPPSPLIPKQLHGHQTVHLALASTRGPSEADALREALRRAPTPAIDTWAASDLETLGEIHLDPPSAEPALGIARWLKTGFANTASQAFRAFAAADVQMVEVRHVANDAPAPPGALDRAPGDFMLHAVGAPSPSGPAELERAFATILAAAASSETGLAIGSWSDGRTTVPDGLPADVRARVARIADQVDPDKVVARPPVLATLTNGTSPRT